MPIGNCILKFQIVKFFVTLVIPRKPMFLWYLITSPQVLNCNVFSFSSGAVYKIPWRRKAGHFEIWNNIFPNRESSLEQSLFVRTLTNFIINLIFCLFIIYYY